MFFCRKADLNKQSLPKGKNMGKKNIKILLAFLFIMIFLSTCIFSCNKNSFELFQSLDDGAEDVSGNDIVIEMDVKSKEFFLESKEKQKNKSPLNDINIRKAIFYGIDRERIVKELFGEYGEVLNSLFSKGSYYHNQSWREYDYDPDKAKDFLSKAGYGVDNPLYITIGSIDNSDIKQRIEEMIKEDLEKIGIEIWIFNKPSEEWYQDFVAAGNYELGIWSIYNFDGSDLNSSFSSEKIPPLETEQNKNCENFYWYSSSDADEILKNITAKKDDKERKELFGQLQDTLADNAVVLPLYSRLFSIAYNNRKIKKIDIDIKKNKVFFNIENWRLSEEAEKDGIEESEVIIGCGGESCSPRDLFNSNFIRDLISESLWETNEAGEYEPVLVEETYTSSEEYIENVPNLEVIVLLRDKIFWQNGEPITSEDVKYTFETIVEYSDNMGGDKDYSKIKEIEIIDERRFKVIFNEYSEDWYKLFDTIVPRGSLAEKEIDNITIGDIIANGPYKVAEYREGEYLLLKKNEFYSGVESGVGNIKFLFDSDINNLIGMLGEGEIDLLSVLFDLDLMRDLEEDKNINLLVKPGNLIEHLAVCLKGTES